MGVELGVPFCKMPSHSRAYCRGQLPESKWHGLWVAAITKEWWLKALAHLGQNPRMSRELYQTPVR